MNPPHTPGGERKNKLPPQTVSYNILNLKRKNAQILVPQERKSLFNSMFQSALRVMGISISLPSLCWVAIRRVKLHLTIQNVDNLHDCLFQ